MKLSKSAQKTAWPTNATDETNSPDDASSDLSLAMLLALFSLFFFLLAFYMCGFLHAFVSAFIGFCISSFPYFGLSAFLYVYIPPYPLHLLCISAFLHFCIARLLQFWICSRMLRCVYFCIFGFPHFCISIFLSFCMFPDVRRQNFVNVRCFVFDCRRCS